MENLDPRLHFVTVTGIVAKKGDPSSPSGQVAPPRFIIAKRSMSEKAFPGKWTVPGGKLVLTEYQNLPKTSENHPQWYNVVDWVLKKEVLEEVNVEIEKPQYLTDLAFVRPDGYPVITLSYWCLYKSGEAKPGKDLTEVAWVTAEEAKTYDLIDGIAEEIADVAKIMSPGK